MTFTINDGSLQEKCLLCSKPLFGKRRKFCSKSCGDKMSKLWQMLLFLFLTSRCRKVRVGFD